MRFLFIRHGQPEWFHDGAAVDDPVLTDVGITQAQLTGRRFGSASEPIRVDQLLVSPLVRARQTAEPIAEAVGVEPQVCDWLREIARPPWNGAPLEHVQRIFEEHRDKNLDDHWEGLDGGESSRDFHHRVCTGLQGYLDAHDRPRVHDQPALWPGRDPIPSIGDASQAGLAGDEVPTVVVVAHGGTNAALLGYLLGLEPVPWEWERFVSYHAAVSVLAPLAVSGREAYSLQLMSDVSHLPPGLRTR